jgi:hypothetical protein
MPDLNEALRSITEQDYEGPLTVLVAVDERTTDTSLETALQWASRDVRHRWVVQKYPPTTLFEMTVRALEETTEEYAFLLDSDNRLYTDRVSASLRGCYPGRGICLSQVETLGTEGAGPMRPFPADHVQRNRQLLVSGGNFGDSLTQRLRMDWVRSTLLPIQHKVLQLGFAQNASEDFLDMLVAGHVGAICPELAPARPVAEYRYREGALTKTSNMYSRDARTLCAYWILADSGELGEPQELLHADLLKLIPRSRGGLAPG